MINSKRERERERGKREWREDTECRYLLHKLTWFIVCKNICRQAECVLDTW